MRMPVRSHSTTLSLESLCLSLLAAAHSKNLCKYCSYTMTLHITTLTYIRHNSDAHHRQESKSHGWPSFRDEEVVWENMRCLPNGESVSVDGTHLGHNLPDRKGNRWAWRIWVLSVYSHAYRHTIWSIHVTLYYHMLCLYRYCINLVSVAGKPSAETK